MRDGSFTYDGLVAMRLGQQSRIVRSIAAGGAISAALVIVGFAVGLSPTSHTGHSGGTTGGVDFNRDIRPILTRNCFACHGHDGEARQANLRLDVRSSATQVGNGRDRAAIIPGDPDASPLMKRISSNEPNFRMPPAAEHEPLTDEEIAMIHQWISDGAPYEEHWSWQPLRDPPPPPVEDASRVLDSVDRFILARLQSAGLEAAEPADKRTLLRRVYFDLIGLPPTPTEIASFLKDDSPDAYERIVDRLLESPHFGERWGRHWLDLMRYAETHGHEFDYPIQHAWQYRDYVIRALNEDVPYDQFVREHIAGDLLDDPRRHPTEGYNESLIGTGFWFLSQGTHGPVDVREDEAERIDNQIDVMSKAFFGLTVSCARCHDHKFDSITTKDYYALAGFLQSSRRNVALLDPNQRIQDAVSDLRPKRREVSRLLRIAGRTRQLSEADTVRLLDAAVEVAFGAPQTDDGEVEQTLIIFDDFESGRYEGWTVEGTAFGDTPQGQQSLADRQGDVGARSSGFVNSHNAHSGESSVEADRHVGTLTSGTFTIEKPYVHFLIGGGAHQQKTCFNLIVDNEVVRTATGRNHNRMHRATFDVSVLAGKEARFELVDNEQGGWGHIGLDHIVFSDEPEYLPMNQRPLQRLAEEREIDPSLLERWVRAVKKTATAGMAIGVGNIDEARVFLMNAFRSAMPEMHEAATTFTAFDSFDDWFVHGPAFERVFAGDLALGTDRLQIVDADAAHSGLLASRLEGALRSPTFEIQSDFIEYRLRGNSCRIRIIVGGYYLDEFNPLLFDGMTFAVDTLDDRRWHWHRQRVAKYRGHRAYIEILDEGDGWITVDEIRMSDDATLSSDQTREIARADAQDPCAAIAHAIQGALTRLGDGDTEPRDARIINWLLEHDLVSSRVVDADLVQQIESSREAYGQTAQSIPPPMRVLALTDGTPEDERVFVRGSHRNPGEVAPRSFIDSLAGEEQSSIADGSGRLQLAERILDESNPLPARVYVNRVWHHLFGRGLVSTPDDFGGLGQPPSHPELLDHLAYWFRHEGRWSTRALIKRLVMSSTYRMSSETGAHAQEIDPDNTLLHSMRVRRLEAEPIRDAMLAVSGRLDRTTFGPSVPVHLTPFMSGRGRPSRSGPLDGDGRRSIYLEVRRNFLSPFMLTFDAPIPSSTIGNRNVSNVPAQALVLMNDPFVHEQAAIWARRVLRYSGMNRRERIQFMYESGFGRLPGAAELDRALSFLESRLDDGSSDEERSAAWTDLAHVLFNVKEFIYIR